MCYNSNMKNYSSRKGFTLAEVLITLAIIGIVAAITIPTISKNIQQAAGRPIKCHYWSSNPYSGKCTATCPVKNEYGTCIGGNVCAETGLSIPSDYVGPMSECRKFHEELFINTLKTVKICKDHAYEQGCLPKDFRGADVINSEKNPDNNYDPNGNFSDNKIKNNYPVFVLADGTYVIGFAVYFPQMPLYTVDINGHKGPNKWGYDIFSFRLKGDLNNGIKVFSSTAYATEKGGKTFEQMYNECFK